MDRRSFLKVTATAGAGLAIQVFLPGCTPATTPTATDTLAPSPTPTLEPTPTSTPEPPAWLTPDLFVTIGNDGLVTITVARAEMGQGVRTALPMILAEELGADWSTIRVAQAGADAAYGNQVTGGSQSISTGYAGMRRAGALARTMLIGAAAAIWEVEPDSCHAENGFVVHQPTGQQLPFGRLVTKALTMPVPGPNDIKWKPSQQEYRLIGTRVGRIDNPDIVTGRAIYGLDARIPGMLYAAVARSPVFGGAAIDFDDSQALAINGVRQVVRIGGGIAVVAQNTWAALKGREALVVNWDDGNSSDVSSERLRQTLLGRAAEGPAAEGDMLEALYEVPYLSHATMEPMNCVADVRPDSCELWVPTQNPAGARDRAMRLTGLPAASVKVNVTLMGGGFGRRLEGGLSLAPLPTGTDYVAEAVQISQAIDGPVQVVWSREDDIRHDIYHPLTMVRMRARLGDFESLQTRRLLINSTIPIGNWRAVGNVADAFAHECFLDEYASATGVDPLELRRRVGPDAALPVLDLAASQAGWGTPLPAGHGRGIAYHATWSATKVAIVAEVWVGSDGSIKVLRVVAAVDCGLAINPDMVEAQIEGGIIYGLTAALKDPITVENGRVQQSNFHDNPLLRFDESPVIEVHILPSAPSASPKGVGEMSNPVIMPAVANAIFAATGKRIRRLPIRAEDLRA